MLLSRFSVTNSITPIPRSVHGSNNQSLVTPKNWFDPVPLDGRKVVSPNDFDTTADGLVKRALWRDRTIAVAFRKNGTPPT